MGKSVQVVLVYGDGWEAMYVNGVLQLQGHTISAFQALNAMYGQEVGSLHTSVADWDWLEEQAGGLFPRLLKDVKFDEEN